MKKSSPALSRLSITLVLALIACVSAVGCLGIGIIHFEPENGGPSPGVSKSFKAFDIDCTDTFKATGGNGALGAAAGNYSVSCTQDGHEMTAKVLGAFHAAPAAAGQWDKYRAQVTERARNQGCPRVAVRKTEPSVNQQGEAIGAFCVEA
jgi:hypothetical protein